MNNEHYYNRYCNAKELRVQKQKNLRHKMRYNYKLIEERELQKEE